MAITYVQSIDKALEVVTDEEVREKLEALKVALIKRHSSAESKKAKEAQSRAMRIYDALVEVGKPVTIAELKALTSDEEVAQYTPQRFSALFKKLGDKVEKTYKGKTAYWSAV